MMYNYIERRIGASQSYRNNKKAKGSFFFCWLAASHHHTTLYSTIHQTLRHNECAFALHASCTCVQFIQIDCAYSYFGQGTMDRGICKEVKIEGSQLYTTQHGRPVDS